MILWVGTKTPSMPSVVVCVFAGVIVLNSVPILAAQAASGPGMPAKSASAAMHEPTPAREQGPIVAVAPAPGEKLQDALTAIVRWDRRKEDAVHAPVELTVSTRPDFSAPIVQTRLDGSAIDYRLPVLPGTHYYWKVAPVYNGKQQPQSAAASDFISGARASRTRLATPFAIGTREQARTGCSIAPFPPGRPSRSRPGSTGGRTTLRRRPNLPTSREGFPYPCGTGARTQSTRIGTVGKRSLTFGRSHLRPAITRPCRT